MCCCIPIVLLTASPSNILTGVTDQATSTVRITVALALPLITGTVFRAALVAGVWRMAVQLTRGVALAATGAEGGVRHLALQPGAVVGDAGILVKIATLLQGKLVLNKLQILKHSVGVRGARHYA